MLVLQDIPAVAVSLDNHLARTEEQYEAAATHTLALLKALLVRGPCGLVEGLPVLMASLMHAAGLPSWRLPAAAAPGSGSRGTAHRLLAALAPPARACRVCCRRLARRPRWRAAPCDRGWRGRW